jgi:hypothetical protein
VQLNLGQPLQRHGDVHAPTSREAVSLTNGGA